MSSPIDKIYEEIFGYLPSKDGVAFERVAAIASHLVEGGEVKHDDRLRGEFSKTLYQMDVHHKTDNIESMGEAKDYSERASKVGRGDLQKLGGALPDLKSIDAGTFFSATGYTKPAKKYAQAAELITGKPINLYGLRPSTEKDEHGFIKTIVINIHVSMPQPEKAKWVPHLTEKGRESLKALLKEGEEGREFKVGLRTFFDEQGKEKLSLLQLTSQGYGDINQETGEVHACFLLRNHFIDINGVLAEIHGLEYELPYAHHTQVMKITDDSKNRFVLLDGEGRVKKIFTDKMLRKYEFDDLGNLKKK